MNDEKYNGWTNYETWCVNLWLANDEGLYNAVQAMDKSSLPDYADALKTFVTESAPTLSGMYSDLLTAALGAVNWYEIASAQTE